MTRTDHEWAMVAQQILADRVASMSGHPRPGDLYESSDPEGPGTVEVLMVGLKADSLVPGVGFKDGFGRHWFHTLDAWLEPVEAVDGKLRPRFVLAQKGGRP